MPRKGRQLLRHGLKMAISSAVAEGPGKGHTSEYPSLPSGLCVYMLLFFLPYPDRKSQVTVRSHKPSLSGPLVGGQKALSFLGTVGA